MSKSKEELSVGENMKALIKQAITATSRERVIAALDKLIEGKAPARATIYTIMVKKTWTCWKKGQFVSLFFQHPVGQQEITSATPFTSDISQAREMLRYARRFIDRDDLFEIVPFEAELTVKKQAKRASRKVKPKKAGR